MQKIGIELHGAGKRYKNDWIFRQLNYTFAPQQHYALLGANGAGKSTLLQVLSANLTPSVGRVSFTLNNKTLLPDELYPHLAWAAPYIELIEELTLTEMVQFQAQFKPFMGQQSVQQIIAQLQLPHAAHKQIRHFSSGMRQRTKLGLAVLSDTPLLLLDEPTTNLDAAGIAWYQALMQQYTATRLVVVASNQPHEYQFCEHRLHIENYKK